MNKESGTIAALEDDHDAMSVETLTIVPMLELDNCRASMSITFKPGEGQVTSTYSDRFQDHSSLQDAFFHNSI